MGKLQKVDCSNRDHLHHLYLTLFLPIFRLIVVNLIVFLFTSSEKIFSFGIKLALISSYCLTPFI